MSLLKRIFKYCLHDAYYHTLESHVHTLMGSNPCHTELVYTFIIIIEQVLQELWEPAILRFQMKPTVHRFRIWKSAFLIVVILCSLCPQGWSIWAICHSKWFWWSTWNGECSRRVSTQSRLSISQKLQSSL
jgi:hypothetical protein